MKKQIEIANNYFVDEDGEVYGKTGNRKAQQISRDGYCLVGLYVEGKTRAFAVHRLVAETFIPNPENKPCVNHIDGNKENNKVSNLEWCTYSENNKHAFQTGLSTPQRGEDNPTAILTDSEVHEICKLMQDGLRNLEIAEKLNVSKDSLKNIRAGKVWNHIRSEYVIPKKSRVISEATAHWICRMLAEGLKNIEIVNKSENDKITKDMVTKIRNRKLYVEISANYNF